MMVSYLVIAALAVCIYSLTFRFNRSRRLLIALIVFAIGSIAFTIWIAKNVDDQPRPGAKPYVPAN
jgi:predicted MFS family arabinose efflux permease